MSRLFSFSLYFISFAPLWLSVVFVDIKSCIENGINLWTEKISIGCIIVVTLICIVILIANLHKNNVEGQPQMLRSVKEEKTITAEYLLSYILPLFAFDFTVWDDVMLFLIFFFSLGFLCIKHNYFSANIVLEWMGFGFYICTFKNEDGIEMEQLVISRRRLKGCIGDAIYLKPLNNEYKLDITK